MPPLRDRRDDIPLLASPLRGADRARSWAGRRLASRPETLARLVVYPWPGNVRELRNVIERAMILDPAYGLENLDLRRRAAAAPPAEGTPVGDRELNLREALNKLERELLLEAHRRAGGVRKEAARLLGIDPRNLSYYMRKHDLDADAVDE